MSNEVNKTERDQTIKLDVSARVYPTKDPKHEKGSILAFASADIGGCFAVTGIKIVEGKDDWAKHPYSHDAFYAASGGTTADVFLCKETNKVYVPGENELFEYTGGYELLLSPEQQAVGTPAQEIETAVSAPKYEATVTAEEAPLLVRLMGKAGITPGRTDHENGDVTFSVAESEKDAVDRLISKLRTEAAKAVAAMSKPKKARRTRPEINYSAFAKLFPEIISGEYRSMRLQAGPSFMPLHVEWIADDAVAVSHTYRQNGDTMYDPEMTFRVDREKGTLEALTFRQDGSLSIYQEVYPEPGKWIPKLRSDLNNFAAQWMKNITEQKYIKERAVAERDGEDVDIFFSPEGAPIAAYDILMREADAITARLLGDESYANARMNSDKQNSWDECRAAISRIVVSMAESNPQFYNVYFGAPEAAQRFRDYLFGTTYRQDMAAEQAPVSAVTLYREALALLVSAVKGSSFYDYLRDRGTDYDSARDELDAEIAAMMGEIKEENPALYDAYHTLPKFREWLIEDILEQTYQDHITDFRDAVQRYADTPDAPLWIQDFAVRPEQDTHESVAAEKKTEVRDPLAPAYQEGDTVYIRNRAFVIAKVKESRVLLQDPAHDLPIYESYGKETFARELLKDRRNSSITLFLSAYLPDVNPVLREALTGDGGLLELRDKAVIAGYIQAGEGNLEIAKRLANTYAGIKGTTTLWTGKGVPAEEIAFIHDAHTEAQKAELFAKVRSGQVRVLLGSTQKMGAGTNVQTRLVASHDLDCPWRPADLEQRAGRIVRRGNENEKVRIFRYVTKGTFDAYNWGLVENKQKFIGQIMTGKSPARSIEDVDATALSYAEVKMLATGDLRIKEKMELDIQVAKLKVLKANHMAQKYEMEDMVIKHYPQKMAEARMFIRALTEDMQIRDMHPVKDDAFSMTVRGQTYTERKAAGEAILAACKSMTDPDKPLDLGQFRGFPMQLQLKGEKFVVTMKQNLTYSAELADETLGNVVRINNALEKIAESLEGQKRGLATLEGNLENAKEEATRPFPQEEELATKSARLSELNAELDNEGKSGNEQEQDDEDEPGREPPTPPMPGDNKPSIRAAIRAYNPPAPVSPDTEKSQRREATL